MEKKNKISIIIPAYNAIDYLWQCVSNILILMDNSKFGDFEIIIAEDGSTDGSAEFASNLAESNSHILHLHSKKRLGKGGALLKALKVASGDIVINIDADLDIPLRYASMLINHVIEGNDISFISKRHPQSKVKSPWYRTIMSVTYDWLVRLILGSKCYSHQGGMKCFRKTSLKTILPYVKDRKWFLDTEILVLAQWKGLKLAEVPVECSYGYGKTTVNIVKDSLQMFYNILELKHRERHMRKILTGIQELKVGMVSSYPPSGDKHSDYFSSAIPWYTGNLISSLRNRNIKIEIYTNKLEGLKKHYDLGNNTSTFLCWQRGSILYPLQIFTKIIKNRPTLVHIQHEFFLYGTNIISAVAFPILLLLIKIIGIPIIVTLHGIVPLSKVDKNFIKNNQRTLPPFITKLGFFILVKMITIFSSIVIVHEHLFKKVLSKDYGCPLKKIKVIPLGIEERKDGVSKVEAKKILNSSNKKVILFFGNITGYKGIELLMEAFQSLVENHPDYLLVIAGGEHPHLRGQPEYKIYYSNLQSIAKQISSEQIVFVGFVPEDMIFVYFSAADVVVLPYTVCMSSSGPLTLAVAYKLPFLVSQEFKEAITLEDIIFERKPEKLAGKIEQFFIDAELQKKALEYSNKLRKERIWPNVGEKTYSLYIELFQTCNQGNKKW